MRADARPGASIAVEIEELVLRLPGISRAAAPGVARAIVERVQERLRGTGRVGRIRIAQVRLQVPAGLRTDELIDRVADRIAEVAW